MHKKILILISAGGFNMSNNEGSLLGGLYSNTNQGNSTGFGFNDQIVGSIG